MDTVKKLGALLFLSFCLLPGIAGAAGQDSINELIKNGGTVNLAGSYTLTGPIVLTSDLILNGQNATIITIPNSADWSSWVPLVKGDGLHDVAIEGIEFNVNSDGNGETPHGRGFYNCIHLIDSRNVTVRNCVFHDGLGDGLRVNSCKNVKFNDNVAYKLGHDCFYSIDSEGVLAWNNTLTTRTNSALRLWNSKDAMLFCNRISSQLDSLGGNAGIQIEDSKGTVDNIRVFANTIYTSWGPGIWLISYGPGSGNLQNIGIDHNRFLKNGVSANIDYTAGITINGMGGTNISYNVFDGCNNAGILILDGGQSTKIEKNIITNTHEHPAISQSGTGYGIANRPGAGIYVLNNCFFNNANGNVFRANSVEDDLQDPSNHNTSSGWRWDGSQWLSDYVTTVEGYTVNVSTFEDEIFGNLAADTGASYTNLYGANSQAFDARNSACTSSNAGKCSTPCNNNNYKCSSICDVQLFSSITGCSNKIGCTSGTCSNNPCTAYGSCSSCSGSCKSCSGSCKSCSGSCKSCSGSCTSSCGSCSSSGSCTSSCGSCTSSCGNSGRCNTNDCSKSGNQGSNCYVPATGCSGGNSGDGASCQGDTTIPTSTLDLPVPGFTANPVSGSAPLTVNFYSTAQNADSIKWNFGDDSNVTEGTNVSHTYSTAGTYMVIQNVSNENGSRSTSAQIYVTLNNGVALNNGVTLNKGNSPGVSDLTNSGSPAGSSTKQVGSTDYKASVTTLAVNFNANAVGGTAPLSVTFTDASTGATSYNWDFGDGVGTSTDRNPTYIFKRGGSYEVVLTVSDDKGNSVSKHLTITVMEVVPASQSQLPADLRADSKSGVDSSNDRLTNKPTGEAAPVADFITDKTDGQAPLEVRFTDTTKGKAASYSWDFGDGVTSTEQDPSHTYTAEGDYITTLTVTGSSGEKSTSQTIINVRKLQSPEIPADNINSHLADNATPLNSS